MLKMKKKIFFPFVFLASLVSQAQINSSKHKITHADRAVGPQLFQYNKDEGFRYKKGDFT